MENELKPCPFCGSKALTIYIDYMIQCQGCETIFIQPQSENSKSMIKEWNRRCTDGT